MLSIAVIGYNRIRSLYVTLCSIFKMKGIEDIGVSVYLDGKLDTGHLLLLKGLIRDFPIKTLNVSPTNLGIRNNILRALRSEFDKGSEEVLYFEDDTIVRPDALEFLSTCSRDSFFTCIAGGGSAEKELKQLYVARGNLISQEHFRVLDNWIAEDRFVGVVPPGWKNSGRVLKKSDVTHDSVFDVFLLKTGNFTRFTSIGYTAHFGIFGVNYKARNATEEALRIDSEMFSRAKEYWLEDVLKVLRRGNWSNEIRQRLWPRYFIYN